MSAQSTVLEKMNPCGIIYCADRHPHQMAAIPTTCDCSLCDWPWRGHEQGLARAGGEERQKKPADHLTPGTFKAPFGPEVGDERIFKEPGFLYYIRLH